MKKTSLALAIATCAIASLIAGCSTKIEASKIGSPLSVEMNKVYVQPIVESKNEPITGSASVHSILGLISWGPNAQAIGVDYGFKALSFTSPSDTVARNAASYEATTKANADVILAPQYILTKKDYVVYKKINCVVKGYPGFLKGVKVINPDTEDAEKKDADTEDAE